MQEQYEILRLSGSYTISEDGRIQTEGFNVLLACSDGHVIGGTLAGSLLAATPVQVRIHLNFALIKTYMTLQLILLSTLYFYI